jgi:hypothetical protein
MRSSVVSRSASVSLVTAGTLSDRRRPRKLELKRNYTDESFRMLRHHHAAIAICY